MNNPTLEDQLRSHYLSKADELRLPPLEFEEMLADADRGVLVAITSASRDHRGNWWVAAAAVAAVAVGGLAIIQGRDTPSSTQAATQPSQQLTPVSIIGLFPVGDAAAVLEQAYQTPESVATAYLADRTSAANLPPGYTIEATTTTGYTAAATIGDVVTLDETHALVKFHLQVHSDGGDGIVQVEQVRDSTGATGWVVTSASVISMELTNLSYIDGRLLGTVNSGPGATTQLTVLDAATGAVLATQPGTSIPPAAETADQSIDIPGLTAPSVVVRVWGTPFATFSETLINSGQQGIAGGWTPLAALAYPPQLQPSVSSTTPPEQVVTSVQPSGSISCDGYGCYGFDLLPVAPGVTDYYLGAAELGTPQTDLGMFDQLTRCVILDAAFATCTKIEGIAGLSLVSYPLTNVGPSASVAIGTTFTDITPQEYANAWGPTAGDGPTSQLSIRGHDAIQYLNEADPGLVWQERPGVLVWVVVPPQQADQLVVIAEGVRSAAGPTVIPYRVVVPIGGVSPAASYQINTPAWRAIDNNGDGVVIAHSNGAECVGYGFVDRCGSTIQDRTFIRTALHYYDLAQDAVGVAGSTPAEIHAVDVTLEDGTVHRVPTATFANESGRFYDVTFSHASIRIIQWIDANGQVTATLTPEEDLI